MIKLMNSSVRLASIHRIVPGLGRALLCIAFVCAFTAVASACPTCKEGLAQNDPHGQSVAAGYYYSILFMMATPYVVLTTLGACAYRAVKKAQSQSAAANQGASTTPTP
jgi:uncharacterized paraquat-inducible protein A